MNKGAVYGLLFGTVVVLLIVYACWKLGLLKTPHPLERFDASEATDGAKGTEGAKAAIKEPSPLDSVQEGTYGSQMHVIRTFEKHVGRKPTVEELKKYSVLLEEDDILSAIVTDFPRKKKNEEEEPCDDEEEPSDTEEEPSDSEEEPSDSDSSDDDAPSAWPPRNKHAPAKQPPAKQPQQPKPKPQQPAPAKQPKPVKPVKPAKTHQRCKPMQEAPKGIICVDRADLLSRLKAISNEVDCFYDMLRLMK